jgi:hypothetical protein
MPKRRRWEVLADMANALEWRRMAEIGVFKGQTAEYLLRRCKRLSWVGVDTWQHGDPALDVPDSAKKTTADTGHRSYVRHPLDQYRRQVEAIAMRYPGRATIIPTHSVLAAEQVEDGSLCAVFVDGDHTPAGVQADLRAWASKIRLGGMMCGHDYNMPCIAEVLERMAPGYEKHDDSVWSVPVEGLRL